MILAKLAKQSIFILLVLIALSSCTVATTKRKDPVFTIDIAAVGKELHNVVISEHINLDGKIVTTNKKSTSQLEISIANGENIPPDDNEMESLRKTIASIVKKDLQDQ